MTMSARQVLKWIVEPQSGAFPVTDVDLYVAGSIVAILALALVVWLMRRRKQCPGRKMFHMPKSQIRTLPLLAPDVWLNASP